jgi:hypothetical protein
MVEDLERLLMSNLKDLLLEGQLEYCYVLPRLYQYPTFSESYSGIFVDLRMKKNHLRFE